MCTKSAVVVILRPVTGSADGLVRVWDLTAGTPIGGPLAGHSDWVSAVTTLLLCDHGPIAVTATHDATVRVWDLTTG